MWMTQQTYLPLTHGQMQIENIAKKLCEKQDLNIHMYVTPRSF